jgi:hypothetical protein
MRKPEGYDPALAARSECPQEWIDYFMGVDDDEPDEEEVEESQEVKVTDSRLFNVSEEQVNDPNFWINL